MTVVTFNVDQYPYCKGDVVDLDSDQKKAVDAEAERRGVENTYTTGEHHAEAASTAEDLDLAEEYRQAEFNAQAKAEREEREAIRAEADSVEEGTELAAELPTVEEPTPKAKAKSGK